MCLSELRLLLLGNKAAGKSSVGNAILGRDEFSSTTAQCVRRQGEVAGRHITVVEAPGWWKNYLVKDTPELNKQEIILSTSLCPPGPHAVLIVLRVDSSFTETNRRAVEERLGFFGETVWRHTMVLFSFGDCLGETSIEQHIKNQMGALQWLVEKCGNRYHVFNNKTMDKGAQVVTLLEKIEEMVREHGGGHFEMEKSLLYAVERRRRMDEKEANERIKRVCRQRETLLYKMGIPSTPQLRIILLGHRHAGKTSAGNTIFSREKYELRRTAGCVKKQGEAAGREVTVVEAPGWWNNYLVKDTPERTKLEILLSMSVCPPGPHALLLVIRVDGSFIEINRGAIEEHVELLGERVWGHTMVLFTCGDWLGDTAIEQHIQSEGNALQWLIEKCGNRYHVLDNNSWENVSQVTELLEKIDEMVSGNGGNHYNIDPVFLETATERQKTDNERAKQLLMKVQDKRKTLRSLMDDTHCFSELRMILLGCRYAGKSSSGNTILAGQEFDLRGTGGCVKRQGEAAGKQITLIEAPGWLRSRPAELTPESDKTEIIHSLSLCHLGPHSLLLVIQADTSFTEKHRRTVEEHMELLGERVWSHTIVLFTCGDSLGETTIEQHIESEGEALQWIVETCQNRYHVLNNERGDRGFMVAELFEKIEEMLVGNNGVYYRSPGNLFLRPAPDRLERKLKKEKKKVMMMVQEQNAKTEQAPVDIIVSMQSAETHGNLKEKEHLSLANLDIHIQKAGSMPTPLNSGGGNTSDSGSDYGSETSLTGSSNFYTSLMSVVSSVSSGIGSLRNLATKGINKLQLFKTRPDLSPVTVVQWGTLSPHRKKVPVSEQLVKIDRIVVENSGVMF
ncbi:GTPase IMAP family member 8-like [Chanos chanos]|uniref:GTPase IMAP family member 8-like n=1 Tax=Chanos chanos TaxID=29144 RepID=A0A6J2UPI6_CHACN|nr:GTPase IMAP family member 8-like [Chanos chanos]